MLLMMMDDDDDDEDDGCDNDYNLGDAKHTQIQDFRVIWSNRSGGLMAQQTHGWTTLAAR